MLAWFLWKDVCFMNKNCRGFTTNFTDPEKAAKTLLYAMNLSPKEKKLIGKNAKEFVKHYSWKTNIHKFEDVYNELEKEVKK